MTIDEAKAGIKIFKEMLARKNKMLKDIEGQVAAAESLLALAEKGQDEEEIKYWLEAVYNVMRKADAMKNEVNNIGF